MQLVAQVLAAAGKGVRIALQQHDFVFYLIGVGVQSPSGSIVFGSDGSLTTSTASLETITPAVTASEWLRGGAGSSWEMRLTKTAGDDTNLGDALSTWLALSSDRSFGQSVTGGAGASRSGTFTAEFRGAGSGTIEATVAGIVITAEVI